MSITVAPFEVTAGLYASWSTREQARAIEADLNRVMAKYIHAELAMQGVDEQPSVVVMVFG